MNKPITLVYEEFKANLMYLINSSGLPAFVIEPVLLQYASEVKAAANSQYEEDLEKYQSGLRMADSSPEDANVE